MKLHSLKPDSYLPNIYSVNYYKLHENGIRCALFDIDCTILPFDKTVIDDDLAFLFRYIKNVGIKPALFSSNFENRVVPVARELDVNYACLKPKPFVSFSEISGLFDGDCVSDNTVYIGDSFFFDMVQADNLGVYKILVDVLRDRGGLKLYANDFLQMIMCKTIVSPSFQFRKYYRGHLER